MKHQLNTDCYYTSARDIGTSARRSSTCEHIIVSINKNDENISEVLIF